MKARAAGIITASLIAIQACDRAETGGEGAELEVRDSLGIEVVTVTWEAAPFLDRVDPIPEWVVGADKQEGSPVLLHRVRDALLLSDGSLVIAQSSNQEVIRIDLASQEVLRWGGPGDGPGEFRNITRIFEPGRGRIGLVDGSRRRYVEFDLDGQLIREANLGPYFDGSLVDVEVGPDNALYVNVGVRPPEGRGVVRPEGLVVKVRDVEAPQVDTLVSLLGPESYFSPEYMGLLWFGATGVMAAAEAGVWIADTGQQELVYWEGRSSPTRVVRWQTVDTRVLTEERKQELWELSLAGFPPEERSFFEQQRNVMPFRERVPAFGSLLVGTDGSLWIGSYVPYTVDMAESPRPGQEWLVLDFEQRTAHRVTTPRGFRLVRVSEEFVLGVHRDEFGVETIRRHRLQ